MAKLTFNDHLDDMMERLMDEKLTPEKLELEVNRARALALIADKKINHHKNIIVAAKLVSAGDVKIEFFNDEIKKLH